jgi:DNA-directed RNA polymerase specialized sigma54-like protein
MANMESQISRLKAALALQAEANKALTKQRNETMSSLANRLDEIGYLGEAMEEMRRKLLARDATAPQATN